MTGITGDGHHTAAIGGRRWLLGVEPFFEGGWWHRGRKARRWDVEGELIAISILGDVTVDLANARTLPHLVVLKAFAIGRDVDVLVKTGTHVELSGRAGNGHVNNQVPSVAEENREHIVRILAYTGLGDINVRVADRQDRIGS